MLIRRFLILLIILISAAWTHGSPPSPGTMTWAQIPIGAGGFVTGISFAPDGTGVARTDSYGAYLKSASATCPATVQGQCWRQLYTSTMKGDLTAGNANSWDIAVAPSQTSRIITSSIGFVFISDNGTPWRKLTAFPVLAGTTAGVTTGVPNSDPNGAYKLTQQKLVFDPQNANVIYEATNNHGLQVSFDGGTTASNSTTSTLGNGTIGPGYSGIVFDPNSGTSTCPGGVGSCTNTIFVSGWVSGGLGGVWQSLDGGTSWTQIADGSGGNSPLRIWNAYIAPDGAYWATDNSKIWKYPVGGPWLKITGAESGLGGPGYVTAAVPHPTVTGFVSFLVDMGAFRATSTNDGTFVVGTDNSNCNFFGSGCGAHNEGKISYAANDIPWLLSPLVNTGSKPVGGAAYNPITGELCVGEGIGIFCGAVPTSLVSCSPSQCMGSFSFTSNSASVEELDAEDIVAPLGGVPVITFQDRPVFTVNSMTSYPTSYGPTSSSFNFGYAVDYASSDPSVVCIRAESGLGSPNDQSSCSNNFGQPGSWGSPFTGIGTNSGGAIAVGTATDIVLISGAGLYCSTNGASFSLCTSVPSSGWNGAHENVICADRATPGAFYAYLYVSSISSTLYTTTSPGSAWTVARSGAPLSNSSGGQSRLRCVKTPTNTNDLWFAAGLNSYNAAGPFLTTSTDNGATWTTISAANGFQDVRGLIDFGFGAPASPGGYPTIWVYGYVDTGSGSQLGVYRSTDRAVTWTKMSPSFPDTLDYILTVNGDMNDSTLVYAGMGGSGAWRGKLNYLLKRDLDPAANDNGPAFLNKAA